MSSQLKAITEKTVIPISLLVVIIGGVMWLTSLWELSQSSAAAIKEIKEDGKVYQREIDHKFDRILDELNYLKGKMDGHFSRKAKE